MTVKVLRWEWRTFGDRFGRAEAVFGALTQTGVQESDELYLLRRRARISRSATNWWTSRCSERLTMAACSGGSPS